MISESTHLTALDFDALDLGALAARQTAVLHAHLGSCPACLEQHEARRALVEHFQRDVLPRSLPGIRKRLESRGRRRIGWWPVLLSPVACGVALALFFVGRGPGHVDAPPAGELGVVEDGLGIKGGGGLFTYVRQGGRVSRLVPGTILSAGDALRFAVEPGQNRHLLIAGVDGSGRASAYYPFGEWKSVPIESRGRFDVPGSIVLDDSAGPERIFALLSRKPIDGEQIRGQLESLARRGEETIRATVVLSIPGVETTSIGFEKHEKAP